MIYDHPVTNEVRALAGLDLEGLRSEWRRRYGDPPKLRSADLLALMLGWRMQSEVFGGFDITTRKLLSRKSTLKPGPQLDPGMRLEREWRGRREVVEVVEGGFRWNGAHYKSLSRIAFAITGTKWNGPAFFGLRRQG